MNEKETRIVSIEINCGFMEMPTIWQVLTPYIIGIVQPPPARSTVRVLAKDRDAVLTELVRQGYRLVDSYYGCCFMCFEPSISIEDLIMPGTYHYCGVHERYIKPYNRLEEVRGAYRYLEVDETTMPEYEAWKNLHSLIHDAHDKAVQRMLQKDSSVEEKKEGV